MTTMQIASTVLGAMLLHWPAASAGATQLFAYPNKGQSDTQQHKDEVDCGGWAARQSGSAASDPEATASPEAQRGAGGVGRGMLRGRMIGGAAGNSSAGAMGGGMAAILRRRMMEKKQGQAAGQGQAGEKSAFDRAYKACMEGRGYTVE